MMYEFIKGQGWIPMQGSPVIASEWKEFNHLVCTRCGQPPGEHYDDDVNESPHLVCDWQGTRTGMFR